MTSTSAWRAASYTRAGASTTLGKRVQAVGFVQARQPIGPAHKLGAEAGQQLARGAGQQVQARQQRQ